MRTIYRMATCGNKVIRRNLPMKEEIPNGWYDSENIAELEFKKLQENRINEYNDLLPLAMEVLEQKELKLMDTINSLGCYVFTNAEAHDDTGLESWLTLEISLIGNFGKYTYTTDVII